MAGQSKNSKLFLIGLPGSGKTTMAKQVAEYQGLAFVDLDKEIEKSESKKVEEIFAELGEVTFRRIEAEVLKKFCGLTYGFVMATGGGAPCFGNNLELMKASGKVVFLDVPTKEIASRISKQSLNRPLLKNETPDSMKDRIEFLRSHRISFYRQAHFIVSGSQIIPKEIIDLVAS